MTHIGVTPEKPKTVAGATRMFFVCTVTEEGENTDDVNWNPIRVTSIDSSYSCNDRTHASFWTKMENPLIQFANPDPDSVELFSESELAFEPVWTPNPTYAGMSMIATKVASKCKGLQVAGNTFFGLVKSGGRGVDYYQFDRRYGNYHLRSGFSSNRETLTEAYHHAHQLPSPPSRRWHFCLLC